MFPYVIRYKQGKKNVVADAFSQWYVLISTLKTELLCFEHIKELDADDPFILLPPYQNNIGYYNQPESSRRLRNKSWKTER